MNTAATDKTLITRIGGLRTRSLRDHALDFELPPKISAIRAISIPAALPGSPAP